MITTQLRRYTLEPGEADAFVAWWRTAMPELRAQFGMSIPFAYLDPHANEFIWAVSVRGDRAEFERVETVYLQSAGRAALFEGLPERVASRKVAVVDQVW